MSGHTVARIAELEERIADLRARLPRHSVPPAMFIELEDLEEELERAHAGVWKPEGQAGDDLPGRSTHPGPASARRV